MMISNVLALFLISSDRFNLQTTFKTVGHTSQKDCWVDLILIAPGSNAALWATATHDRVALRLW